MARGKVNVGGASTPIKSTQTGEINTDSNSFNATISSVNVDNSIIRVSVSGDALSAANILDMCYSANFINSTTINLSRNSSGSVFNYVLWEVIEFYNLKSKQTGVKNLSTGNEDIRQTVSVSSINIDKSMLFITYQSSAANSQVEDMVVNYKIDNPTQISFRTQALAGDIDVYWQLAEFY